MDYGGEAEDAEAAALVEPQVVGLGDEPHPHDGRHGREHALGVLLEHGFMDVDVWMAW